tara:strand:+ start:163 stop:306 length:144 start_codon:yes stop_codon:yes gene_type:complete
MINSLSDKVRDLEKENSLLKDEIATLKSASVTLVYTDESGKPLIFKE